MSEPPRVYDLAFPDYNDFVPGFVQSSDRFPVAADVHRKLGLPEFPIISRHRGLNAAGMPVPEAAMDEYSESPRAIREIR